MVLASRTRPENLIPALLQMTLHRTHFLDQIQARRPHAGVPADASRCLLPCDVFQLTHQKLVGVECERLNSLVGLGDITKGAPKRLNDVLALFETINNQLDWAIVPPPIGKVDLATIADALHHADDVVLGLSVTCRHGARVTGPRSRNAIIVQAEGWKKGWMSVVDAEVLRCCGDERRTEDEKQT